MTLNHPIFTRWPAQYPDRLQRLSAPTPDGVKVGIMLEETSLAYEPRAASDGEIEVMLRGRERTQRLSFILPARELARGASFDLS